MIEDFFKNYQYTLQAVSAFATVAAVIVSLWLARLQFKSQLRASVTINLIVYHGKKQKAENVPKYLFVNLTNVGFVTVHIPYSSFVWRIPFQKDSWLANPVAFHGDAHIPARASPISIEPKRHDSLAISDYDMFSSQLVKMSNSIRPRFLSRIIMARIKAEVHMEDGTVVKAHLSNELRKTMRDILKSKK